MKNILCCLLLVLWSSGAFAQNETRPNERQAGYYTFGINTGLAYQSSDVCADIFGGNGWGLSLARNIYYRPGATFSFDVRGRFLMTRQVGFDGERSTLITDNPVLNGSEGGPDYRTYPADLGVTDGFFYYNHQTRTAELALEGVIDLNRLREQSNWIISLYGGIGLAWYRARINALDDSDTPYYRDFVELDPTESASRIRRQLRQDILDDSYESTAAGFSGDAGKLGFMPSVGLDVGYQISPKVSIHLGHRLTFAGTDILDGNPFADAAQDRYHYTNLSLRFIVDAERRSRPVARGPDIRITSPEVLPFYSSSRRNRVQAEIRNVNAATDITATFNGRSIGFDYASSRFSRELVLENGRNTLVISAQNAAGRDREEVILFYTPDDVPTPTGRAPQITLTQPGRDPFRTETDRTRVEASVLYVEQKEDIDLFVNGQRRSFDFQASRNRLQASIDLVDGNNRVLVRARNRFGTDETETLIVRETRVQGPEVRIQSPRDGERTEASRQRLTARLQGINRRQELELRVNGQLQSDFELRQNNTELTTMLTLRTGDNRIELSARTAAGQARDEVSVYRERKEIPVDNPPQPPRVRISTPADNSSTDQARINLKANLENISRKQQIELRLNGTRQSDFSYRSGRLTATLNLRAGNNTIRLIATNADGKDEDGINVQYQPPSPPSVSIQKPGDGDRFLQARQTLTAQTQNVDRKDQIEFLLNGSRFSNFRFDRRQNRLTADLTLREGANSIQIKVNTAGGMDQDRIDVTYSPVRAPTVTFIKPDRPGTRTTNPRQNFTARIQEVDRADQIRVRLNGKVVTNFRFDAQMDQLSLLSNLQVGENTLNIRATTEGGTAEATTRVYYDKRQVASRKPSVAITSISRPVTDPTNPNPNPTSTILAQMTHVSSADQITLVVNGNTIKDFSYQARTGAFSATVQMVRGNNTVLLRVVTPAGSAEDSRDVGM